MTLNRASGIFLRITAKNLYTFRGSGEISNDQDTRRVYFGGKKGMERGKRLRALPV